MSYKSFCANCKKEFVHYYPNSKYCSNKCKYEIEGIKERECPVCKNVFKPLNKKQIHCNLDCYSKSEKLKEEARTSYLIQNNGQWKSNLGNIKEDAGYSSIHEWIRRYKPFSYECYICGEKVKEHGKLDCANISGEYKRDINDFVWLCRSCHTKFDKLKKKLKYVFEVIGVESKKAKYLDAKERRIAKWYLEHETFNNIYVAYPLKNKMSDKRKKGIAYYKLEKNKLK